MDKYKIIEDEKTLNSLIQGLEIINIKKIEELFEKKILSSIFIPEPNLNFNKNGEIEIYIEGDEKRLKIEYYVSSNPLTFESELFTYKNINNL